jgi:hypothetical protein
MRALILIAAVLALAACKNNDQAANTQNVDESMTAENIVSNDVTAIDAVTGDAANMAAEAGLDDLNAVNVGNAGNMSSPARPVAKRPPPAARPDEPTTNTPDASGNAAE